MYFVSVALLPCCYKLLVLLLLELLLSDPFTWWYTTGRVRVPLSGSGSFQARASLRSLRGERARTCIRKLAGSPRPPTPFTRSPTVYNLPFSYLRPDLPGFRVACGLDLKMFRFLATSLEKNYCAAHLDLGEGLITDTNYGFAIAEKY